MVFSSLIFLYAFLPLSLLCYFLCRSLRAKNVSLLVFSLIFYAWGEPKYVLLLMLMALVDWFCALRIENAAHTGGRRFWLIFATVVDLSLIGFFKYAGMVCSIFGTVPDFVARIALPIGISFYTFQLLTYVVDVYRGDAAAERAYWHVLLYAALFHQCIAGPIVRYNSIADELFVQRADGEEMSSGVRRFSVGLAKKALLANPCGELADAILLKDSVASDPALFLDNLSSLQGVTVLGAWMGMLAFMLQIYLDFSAYSDMAIGMGKMLGLHYPENFNYPYTARSVTDFWRRWHMSLSSFFRDYVYIPLGGNRCSPVRNIFNTFVVWALTGLWHGASWNFVFWGLYYFVFLMIERAFLKSRLDKMHVLPHLYLLFVVFCGWILFHFTDVRLGWTVVRGLFGLNGNALSDFISVTLLQNNVFLLLASVLACTPLVRNLSDRLADFSIWEGCRSSLVPVVLLLLSTCALVGESYNPFLYFQF
ncbi:MAG: MBOAT family protein [Oscillospiraceae bacterium]|nr:MBOAT family protein [Oscillospiraceae bacterium]MBR0393435.1 MBOAT family protein [Oscillospiraceae bacterium]